MACRCMWSSFKPKAQPREADFNTFLRPGAQSAPQQGSVSSVSSLGNTFYEANTSHRTMKHSRLPARPQAGKSQQEEQSMTCLQAKQAQRARSGQWTSPPS